MRTRNGRSGGPGPLQVTGRLGDRSRSDTRAGLISENSVVDSDILRRCVQDDALLEAAADVRERYGDLPSPGEPGAQQGRVRHHRAVNAH